MNTLRKVFGIARYEMLLIFRSWAFRIFSGLALLTVTLIVIAVSASGGGTLFFNRALSGGFPLIAVKLFNVFLGLIVVFLATEFLKRDRKQDTSQVYFAHSFSNGAYILGKFLGIFFSIALLNLLILLATWIIHFFFSNTIFAWEPYLLYAMVISFPTVVFMIGLSFFLGTLIRSQAVVYLLALVYGFFVLIVIGPRAFFVLDSFAFFEPVMYSDFIGLGNIADLLLLRGAYVLLGLGLAFGSVLFINRLRQSAFSNRSAGVLAVGLSLVSIVLFSAYLREQNRELAVREEMRTLSLESALRPALILAECDIRIQLEGRHLSGDVRMTLANRTDAAIEDILLSINPGLRAESLQGPTGSLAFEQDLHLITARFAESISPGEDVRLSITYSGRIDESYCYLDLDDGKYKTPLRVWLASVPKRFAIVDPQYVHLTPECGWYPRPGLPPSLVFPEPIKRDYSRYTLTVSVPDGMTAIAQGAVEIGGAGPSRTFHFVPETLLSQMSLTVGRYEKKSITVDETEYSLFMLEGHDRFTPLLSEIGEGLPEIIRQAKNSYEVRLGLDYPYKRLSLVEVPIQFTSHNRLWNTALEQVQPEIVFLPEMGALCNNTDFRSLTQNLSRRMGRGGRMEFGPSDIQEMLLNRMFIPSNLTEQNPGLPENIRTGVPGIRTQTNSEARYGIFPLFFTYSAHFATPDWPLFGYVVEAYLRGLAAGQAGVFMRQRAGMNEQVEISAILMDHSLSELLTEGEGEDRPLTSILDAKANQLLALIKGHTGIDDFDERFRGWIKERLSRPIAEEETKEFFASVGAEDFGEIFQAWFEDKGLAGFLFGNIQSFRVIDGEREKTQLAFDVTNPTDKEGVIKVDFVARGRGMDRATSADSRHYIVPPQTVKEIGIVMEETAVMTSIDTSISLNNPSGFVLPFMSPASRPDLIPFDGERVRPYVPIPEWEQGVYIVDNEDTGFLLPEGGKESWLRRVVRKIFTPGRADTEDEYGQMRSLLNPPDYWTAVVMQNFYGQFVRSAHLKKSGDGESKVTWSTELRDPGDYAIYFYNENLAGGMRGGQGPGGGQMARQVRQQIEQGAREAGRRFRRLEPGKKYFIIHHEDGAEDVVIDLTDATEGWNLIGTFRLLAGLNRIEQTDQNDEVFVLADAIRWVKQK